MLNSHWLSSIQKFTAKFIGCRPCHFITYEMFTQSPLAIQILHDAVRSSFKYTPYPSLDTVEEAYRDLRNHYAKEDITLSMMDEILLCTENELDKISQKVFEILVFNIDWKFFIEGYTKEKFMQFEDRIHDYMKSCYPLVKELYLKQTAFQFEKVQFVIDKNRKLSF